LRYKAQLIASQTIDPEVYYVVPAKIAAPPEDLAKNAMSIRLKPSDVPD